MSKPLTKEDFQKAVEKMRDHSTPEGAFVGPLQLIFKGMTQDQYESLMKITGPVYIYRDGEWVAELDVSNLTPRKRRLAGTRRE